MWKAVASNALTLAVVVLIGLGALFALAERQWTAEGPLTQAICLEVPRGTTMNRVSEELEAQDAISSGAIYRIGADYAGRTAQLKAGSYLVPAGATMDDISRIITQGGQSTCGTEVNYRIGVNSQDAVIRELNPETSRFAEIGRFDLGETPPDAYSDVRERADTRYRITVAEGTTSWQVVEGLRALDILDGEIPEVPAEGTLAPDSYEVRPGTDRAELVALMTEAQTEILAAAWETRAEGLPYETAEEALVMASIIEKETSVPDERRQVSSVFVNRLEQGMRLQTDPTVIYGITRGQGVLGRGLRRSELNRETPWNTYQIDGLPPTPIANPGAAAIAAAMDPDSTDYVFFVADGTGGHAFAETLEEHNRNVARWREIEAERANQ